MASKIVGLAAAGPDDAVRKSELDVARVTVSTTAPTSPVVGQLWLDIT